MNCDRKLYNLRRVVGRGDSVHTIPKKISRVKKGIFGKIKVRITRGLKERKLDDEESRQMLLIFTDSLSADSEVVWEQDSTEHSVFAFGGPVIVGNMTGLTYAEHVAKKACLGVRMTDARYNVEFSIY